MTATTTLENFLTTINEKIAITTAEEALANLAEIRADIYDALGYNSGVGGTYSGATASEVIDSIDASVDIEAIKDSLASIDTYIQDLAGYVDTVEAKLTDVAGSTNNLGDILTANTSSLATINVTLTAIKGYIDGVEGFTDGLETLIGSTNSKLDSIISFVDGLEGYTDGIETSIGTTNSRLSTLSTNLSDVETLITAGNVSLELLVSTLETVETNTDQLENLIAAGNTLLTGIKSAIDKLAPTVTTYRYMGTSAGANVKVSAGKIYSLSCSNLSTNPRYFQLFNSSSTPSANQTALESYPITGGGSIILDCNYFDKTSNEFSSGISWGFSTSALTYVAGDSTTAIVVIRAI
jgi:ABC-type transporter Mla subunit MlaD